MIVHFVGSIPLPDSETVFRTLAGRFGANLARLPDGETGIRQSWIRFLQDVLAEHPAIETATDVPPFKFVQWDGKLIREITRKRLIRNVEVDPSGFSSGYADMAVASWRIFEDLQTRGLIPADIKFQICLPTPTAPTYNNMIPEDRSRLLPPLTRHFIAEVESIAARLPNDRCTIQWDVCQEVLAWEGYYDEGPVDFRTETLTVLEEIGDAVPEAMELGFHLCYGSPNDEHIVQPTDTAIMVEMINAISDRISRSIDYFHLPVPKSRTDEAYHRPLAGLALPADTDLYLGMVHANDAAGNAARLAAAMKFTRIEGIAAECGLGRGDPARLEAVLAAHEAVVGARTE